MPWGSLVGTIVGGMIAGDAADDASSAMTGASKEAIEEQRRQYDQTQANLAPWLTSGRAGLTRMSQLLGLPGFSAKDQALTALGGEPSRESFTSAGGGISPEHWNILDQAAKEEYNRQHGRFIMNYAAPDYERKFDQAGYDAALKDWNYKRTAAESLKDEADFGALNKKFTLADFWDDPITKSSYQSGLDLGTEAIDRMTGARGTRKSGATLKELSRFGTDYTGQKAGESYNRFYGDQERTLNRLAGISGTGQTTGQYLGDTGGRTSANIGNLLTNAGSVRGAAAIRQGNIYGGMAQNIGDWYTQKSYNDDGSLDRSQSSATSTWYP